MTGQVALTVGSGIDRHDFAFRQVRRAFGTDTAHVVSEAVVPARADHQVRRQAGPVDDGSELLVAAEAGLVAAAGLFCSGVVAVNAFDPDPVGGLLAWRLEVDKLRESDDEDEDREGAEREVDAVERANVV
jgi:hypothetical protein